MRKLYKVGPVDNGPSTNFLHHFEDKEKKIFFCLNIYIYEGQVTCDTWQLTNDLGWGGGGTVKEQAIITSYIFYQ